MSSAPVAPAASGAAVPPSPSGTFGMGQGVLSYDQTVALTFHHVDYLIHAAVRYANACGTQSGGGVSSPSSTPQAILVVEAEQRDTGHRWIGEFSAKYIEEMSLKTGNFKKFSLFIRMLSSALSKSSDTVFIDLLTFQDLEALKARKQAAAAAASGGTMPPPQPSRSQVNPQTQNKRYVILTYVAEFDKSDMQTLVHYPLPLKFDSDPSPSRLHETIARLRSELELMRTSAAAASAAAAAATGTASGSAAAAAEASIDRYQQEVYRLNEENQRLKSLVASNTSNVSPSSPSRSTSSDISQLRAALRSATSALESSRAENATLLRQLSGALSGESADSLGLSASLESLSKQIWNLQLELKAEQEAHSACKKRAEQEQELMIAELEKRLEAERTLRAKCRGLQEELDEVKASMGVRSGGGRRGLRGATADTASSGAKSRSSLGTSPLARPNATSSRPTSRSTSRAGSRASSRPGSTVSSRSNSPAPSSSSFGSARNSFGSGRGSLTPPTSGVRARSRSSSPAAAFRSPTGRFDPSAYVKHRQQLLEEKQRRLAQAAKELRASGGRPTSASARGASPMGRSSPSLSRPGSAANTPSSRFSPRNRTSLSSTSPLRPPTSARTQRSPASSINAAGASASSSRLGRARPISASVKATRMDSDRDDDEPNARRGQRKTDMDSIDQRFSALQNFLRQQKIDAI